MLFTAYFYISASTKSVKSLVVDTFVDIYSQSHQLAKCKSCWFQHVSGRAKHWHVLGVPQSGYAYSVIIGFLSSYPYPGWQHHSNTMSVYTVIQFKDHSGDPVVASGYFVDNCESECLFICGVLIFFVWISSCLFFRFCFFYLRSMCYPLCVFKCLTHMQVSIIWFCDLYVCCLLF